ncbi:hypothetical protein A3Q56_06618 [Intoshia linei]|uniref:Uncharacterized protein n=1 Tax=Intoshia linei TaxID=1819745 RepID=A0A177AWA5_9BILA|nr:hypothetical protein A3Q56_06618 [Intoshia linei]
MRNNHSKGEKKQRTDLEHGDYEMEAGAKRCYEASRLAWIAEKDQLEKEALENENNPMAIMENRMKQSKQEMEIMVKH